MTDAQKRANRKYNAAKRDQWTIDAPKGLRGLVDAAARAEAERTKEGL